MPVLDKIFLIKEKVEMYCRRIVTPIEDVGRLCSSLMEGLEEQLVD